MAGSGDNFLLFWNYCFTECVSGNNLLLSAGCQTIIALYFTEYEENTRQMSAVTIARKHTVNNLCR
jgi:hypothetical protein